MAIAASTLAWSVLAGYGAVRALYRRHKAVMRDGVVTACAGGPGCSKSLTVESTVGVAPIFSLVDGRVLRADAKEIRIASSFEPVIVTYAGAFQLGPALAVGTRVGAGQAIAHAGAVQLSVSRIDRDAQGSVSLMPLEPASWLAARGLRASAKRGPGSGLWCDQGRRLTVPQQVGQCGMRLPEPAGFALLPVSVTMQ